MESKDMSNNVETEKNSVDAKQSNKNKSSKNVPEPVKMQVFYNDGFEPYDDDEYFY